MILYLIFMIAYFYINKAVISEFNKLPHSRYLFHTSLFKIPYETKKLKNYLVYETYNLLYLSLTI